VLGEVPNRITLEGHTDAAAFAGEQRGYSNWELSADRANASRRELTAGGLPTDHMLRIQGLADSRPFDDKDPRAPTNRRISIIVMNQDAEARFFGRDPDAALASETPELPPQIRPDLAPLAKPPKPDSSPDASGR
jgi:chemotaxis protein MotB